MDPESAKNLSEADLQELEYRALTARVERAVEPPCPQLADLVGAYSQGVHTHGVIGAAERLLDELHEVHEASYRGMWTLARNLHRNGVPYHILAKRLGVSPMTARRRIAEHDPGRNPTTNP